MPPVLRMGKYVVDGLLGPGGVTETYLVHADDPSDAKAREAPSLLALKLLRPDRVPEGRFAEVAERFLFAGRQLRDFHRPGFSRVVDVCDDPSSTYMVSKYVAGCDLGRLLEACQAEGKPGVHPVLVGLLGSEIARLLQVAHAAKPVFGHLGLCPQNVIVAPPGGLTLLDAGVAASVRAVTEQHADRWSLVAPELQGVDVVASPLGDRAAAAADLYSLGALLFFLLTGRPPRRSPADAANADLLEIPGASGKLAAALRTLLSVGPDDRPESAAVLVEWLAGDVAQVRERQLLIAQGVRAAEKGIRLSSPELPVVVSQAGHAAASANTSAGNAPTGAAASAGATLRLRTALLLFAGVASAGAGLASLLLPEPRDIETPEARTVQDPASRPATPPQAPRAAESSAASSSAKPMGALLAGHLIVETVPPGAAVWVDGVLKDRSFADIVVGGGVHRVAVILPGHRMIRELVDTSKGAIIRRALVAIPPRVRGGGFVDVSCRSAGMYPVLIDDEETGSLCPARMLPTSSGRHSIAIYVPPDRRIVLVEATVEGGPKPASVTFSE